MADDPDADIDVAVACRVLGVSRSGYYDWLGRPPSARAAANTLLLKHIEEIHEQSRGTYGWPRVHAELTLGLGIGTPDATATESQASQGTPATRSRGSNRASTASNIRSVGVYRGRATCRRNTAS
jgi:putative transposase